MLKYWLAGVTVIAAVVVGAFLLLSQFTGGNAQVDPPLVVSLTVTADGTLSPSAIDVPRNVWVQLRVSNEAPIVRRIQTRDLGAQSLPLDTIYDTPMEGLGLLATSGGAGVMRVRFSASGTGTIAALVPGKPETTKTAQITVR